MAAAGVMNSGFRGRNRTLTRLVSLLFLGRAFGDFRYVGYTKRIRGTEFAKNDYFIYSPLCLVVAGLARGAAR